MSEVDGGPGAGAAPADEGGVAPAGGAVPEWMGSLPEDLKSDATLARYTDVEKLARGALDLKKVASSRVVLPGEGADEASWGAFWNQIGRPETADKYEIPVPEGQDTATADAFRPIAHKLGLTGAQAKGVTEFHNQLMADQLGQFETASKAELDAFKSEIGADYEAKLTAAKAAFKSLGVDPATADALDLKLGTANLMRFAFGLAEKMGEHIRVDGAGPDLGGAIDNPREVARAKMQDPAWREKATQAGTPEHAEYNRLLDAARKQASGR